MADSQVPRPKRQGNYYIPERIRLLEREISEKYAAGQSALSLAREYGISKAGVQGAARRQGVPLRGKAEAGVLCRTVDTTLSPDEINDNRPVSQQLAEKMGYGTSEGLSYDRDFQSACMREYRRRSYDRYREIDSRRKKFLDRIPGWETRKRINAFLDMAHDLGLEVDHIMPLQGQNVCGLNVMSNFRIISSARNQSKQNRCDWISDPFIGSPKSLFTGPQKGPESAPMVTIGDFES